MGFCGQVNLGMYEFSFAGLPSRDHSPSFLWKWLTNIKTIFHFAGILLSAPLLGGFTLIWNQPYRFIPLVFFFAIGVGIILSRNNVYDQHTHKKGRLAPYLVFSVTLTIVLVTLSSVIFPSLIQGQYRLVL